MITSTFSAARSSQVQLAVLRIADREHIRESDAKLKPLEDLRHRLTVHVTSRKVGVAEIASRSLIEVLPT